MSMATPLWCQDTGTDLVHALRMAKQDDWVRVTLRIPGELHDQLMRATASGPNSMNAEIIARLQASFSEHEGDQREMLIRRIADEAAKAAVTEIIDTFEATSFSAKDFSIIRNRTKKS